MNSPDKKQSLRKEALLKMLRLPPEKRKRLAELEAKKRALHLPDPKKG